MSTDAEKLAFTRDQVRTELLASLPADPKWATWVDGVLDRLEAAEGVTPDSGREINGGRIQAVWAVFCDACNTWLPEWNRSPDEAEVILREHQDELHD